MTEGFGKIFLRVLAVMLILIGTTLGARGLAISWGFGPPGIILFSGALPAFLSMAVTATLEKFLSGKDWAACLRALGLGRPHYGQLKIALLSLFPIAAAYFLMFFVLGVSSAKQPYLPWIALKFLVSQGIAEELIFRGFVFRRLRGGRSFLRAATLSAVAFSVVHLAGLLRGFAVENLFDVAVSLGFSFLMAYAMAALFENGAGTIWGCTILHFGIDSINGFAYASEVRFGSGNIAYMTGITAAVVMAFWMAPRRFRPLPA